MTRHAGYMVWKDHRIRVRDAFEDTRLDENGVSDGWWATTDDGIAAHMFYPSHMFTFEIEEAPEGST